MVVLGHLVCGNWLQQPRETNTLATHGRFINIQTPHRRAYEMQALGANQRSCSHRGVASSALQAFGALASPPDRDARRQASIAVSVILATMIRPSQYFLTHLLDFLEFPFPQLTPLPRGATSSSQVLNSPKHTRCSLPSCAGPVPPHPHPRPCSMPKPPPAGSFPECPDWR